MSFSLYGYRNIGTKVFSYHRFLLYGDTDKYLHILGLAKKRGCMLGEGLFTSNGSSRTLSKGAYSPSLYGEGLGTIQDDF